MPYSLIEAAECGDRRRVKQLITEGIDLDFVDDEDDISNMTALHCASKNGHASVVRALLKAGADTSVRDSGGRTPLMWASREARLQVVEVLIAANANVNAVSNMMTSTALGFACTHGSVHAGPRAHRKAIVHMLLKAGARVNTCIYVTPAINDAAENGFVDLATILLDHGANVKWSPYYFHGQALMGALASSEKMSETQAYNMVRLLLERGANATCRSRFLRNHTALDFEMRRTNWHTPRPRIVRLLRSHVLPSRMRIWRTATRMWCITNFWWKVAGEGQHASGGRGRKRSLTEFERDAVAN